MKQNLEEIFTNALNSILQDKIFEKNETEEIVRKVGSEFITTVNQQLNLKNFEINLSQTMNILLIHITSNDNKIVEVAISTKEEDNKIKIMNVLSSIFLENLENNE